jgi:putative ABC transport system permease protein
MRWTTAKVDGTVDSVAAFDPSHFEQTMNIGVRSGDVHRLGRDGIAVQADEAKSHALHLGSTVTLWFPETGAQQFHVVSTYETKQPLGSWVISMAAYDANVRDKVDQVLLVKNAPGVSMHDARVAIDHVLAPYPTATLRTKAEFSGSMAARINNLLGLIDVLLGMAVVIALFGIANTLTLSVYERTREIGLLRAVGASRSQVRSAVRWEAVLIALLGTTLGMGLGLGFGASLVTALHGQGFTVLSMPATQLASIVIVAAVAAVLTAALPARRAARLNVLEAVSAS